MRSNRPKQILRTGAALLALLLLSPTGSAIAASPADESGRTTYVAAAQTTGPQDLGAAIEWLESHAATAGIGVARYDIHVTARPAERELDVHASIVAAADGELVLFLTPFASGVTGPGEAVQTPYGWRLVYPQLARGAIVEVEYTLQIPAEAESISLHVGAEEGYLLAESVWIPSVLDGILPRAAPYSLTVVLPAGLSAATAGTWTATERGVRFESPGPARPFIAYALYERREAGSFELWHTPDLGPAAAAATERLAPVSAEIMAWYEPRFGAACDTVRIVTVTRRGGWGAPCTLLLHAPTISGLAEVDGVDASTYSFLAHELAHTWFGNRVAPAGPAYGFLVEGTANYLSTLLVEERFGGEAARAMWNRWRTNALSEEALAEVGVADPAYARVAYAKGAWVHRMLAAWLGRSTYLGVLGDVARHDVTPTLESFRERLEVAGGLDLETFFGEWLYRAEYPRLELTDTAGGWVIENTGTATTPPVPVIVDGEVRRVSVAPGARVRIEAADVRIDPDHVVLAQPSRPSEAVQVRAEACMAALDEALASGDAELVQSLFGREDAAVTQIAGLAGQLDLTYWTLLSAEATGSGTVLTFQVEAQLQGRDLSGPMAIEIAPDGTMLGITSVSLSYS